MKDELQERIQKLKGEFEAGQKMVAELDGKRAELTRTLLRISGAIQVLGELAADEAPSTDGNTERAGKEVEVSAEFDPARELVPQP